jgi:hypothetical protein
MYGSRDEDYCRNDLKQLSPFTNVHSAFDAARVVTATTHSALVAALALKRKPILIVVERVQATLFHKTGAINLQILSK